MRWRKDRDDEPGNGRLDSGEGTPLSEVLASLTAGVVHAKRTMDEASSELAKVYWADPVLRTLPLPSFTLPEIRVRLRFAVVKLGAASGPSPVERGGEGPEIRVLVEAASLQKVGAELISEIELKLTPQTLKVIERAREKTELAGA